MIELMPLTMDKVFESDGSLLGFAVHDEPTRLADRKYPAWSTTVMVEDLSLVKVNVYRWVLSGMSYGNRTSERPRA